MAWNFNKIAFTRGFELIRFYKPSETQDNGTKVILNYEEKSFTKSSEYSSASKIFLVLFGTVELEMRLLLITRAGKSIKSKLVKIVCIKNFLTNTNKFTSFFNIFLNSIKILGAVFIWL